jgi:hypothetical protein
MGAAMPTPDAEIRSVWQMLDGVIDDRACKLHLARLRSEFMAETVGAASAALRNAVKTLRNQVNRFSAPRAFELRRAR